MFIECICIISVQITFNGHIFMQTEVENRKNIIVAGFDPPASCNLGWSIFATDNEGYGRMVNAGILYLPDGEGERLLCIRDFLIELVEKNDINVMCFERAIGFGMAAVREMIGENTGVIKLVGADYGIKIDALATSSMALLFTGFGGKKDKEGNAKKTRTKRVARDIFYPGQSFKQISSHNNKENFEHQADAIGFCTAYLLKEGIPVQGPGGTLYPKS